MPTIQPTPHTFAAERAARWLEGAPVFLDTESTGFESTAQVVDLAIVNAQGTVLFNSLIRPTITIPAEAYAVHGICDADLLTAPTYAELLPHLRTLLDGRRIVTWNSAFDERMLNQSATAHSLAGGLRCTWWDAMDQYARFYGDWNPRRSSFRWQKLDAAAQQCGLTFSGAAHRALADAEMCRQIVCHMARQVPAPPQATQAALL